MSKPESICDRCAKPIDADAAIESDGMTVCDDCACLIADEEQETEK